MRDLYPS